MKHLAPAAVVAVLAAAPALPQENGDHPIVGTWQLVTPQGVVVTEEEFTSQITFTDNGLMSVQAMSPDPDAESAYMRSGYEAYYGTYETDDEAGMVTFTVESAIARDLIGQELERTYEVTDGQLTLEPTDPSESWSVTYEER